MRKVIVAIVFIVVAAMLRDSFRYSGFEIVFDLLLVGAFIYLIGCRDWLRKRKSRQLFSKFKQ